MMGWLEGHRDLALGKVKGPQGASKRREMWEEVSVTLNGMENGACKTWDRWLKSWQDWKGEVKAKAAKIKISAAKTGGGPPLPPLSPLEERLLSVIGGKVASSGLEQVVDALQGSTFGNSPSASLPFPPSQPCTSTQSPQPSNHSPSPDNFLSHPCSSSPSLSPSPHSPSEPQCPPSHCSTGRKKRKRSAGNKSSYEEQFITIRKEILREQIKATNYARRSAEAAERAAVAAEMQAAAIQQFVAVSSNAITEVVNEFRQFMASRTPNL